jgi:hypothetical protein
MKETVAIASIVILFGITDATENSTTAGQNILQVAQKSSARQQTERLHPVTGKRLHSTASKNRWHPAIYKKGVYPQRAGERSARRNPRID